MNNIVISGTSATGKSTLIDKLKNEYNTINEMDFNTDSIFSFFYKYAKKKEQYGRNLFISSMMVDKYIKHLSNKKNAIFDRWIIDYIVAAELRIKPKDSKFFDWFKLKFESMMETVKDSLPEYIILKTTYTEFKKRLLDRGRKDEVDGMLNDDTWYKNYHTKYNDVLSKYLIKYNIKYEIIDTTNKNENETFEKVKEIINKK
ncbi:MAG: AAA family ATPase [Mycoplasma sp.]|nr:AAA family ATPase [Mycoplasma sp.]